MPEVDIKSKVSTTEVANTDDSTKGNLTKRINALKNVQLKIVDVEAKFYEELHQLECKYATLYEPFYEQRRKIVTGEHEPNEEEAKWELGGLTDAVDEAISNGGDKMDPSNKMLLNAIKSQLEGKTGGKNKGETTEKGVPNFWLETMQQFRVTAEIIQEHDEPILAYLQDVKVKLFDKKPFGYKLEFHFAENPYFTNKVLTKTYEYKTDVDQKDPFSFEGLDLGKTTGCKIDWCDGKNVTVKTVKKKLKSKNKKAPPKIVSKEEKQDSFFNFFETPKNQHGSGENGSESALVKKTKNEDEDSGEEEGDEENEDEMYLIADFEIGQYMREKVVPKATLFYTGDLDGMEDDYDYDDEDDEDDDEDEDGDEEDDEGNDDEEDDDEDEEGGGKKKAIKLNGKSGKRKGGEPTPSECKQN